MKDKHNISIDPTKKLLSDSLHYFISKIIPGLMGLLSVTTFVRLVGYEEYGHYAVSLAVVLALSSWMSGWLTPGILRFFSDYEGTNQADHFERAITLGSLASLVPGTLCVFVGLRLFIGRGRWINLVGMSLVYAIFVYTILISKLQAKLMARRVVLVEAVRSVASFTIPAVAILTIGAKHYAILLTGVLASYILPLVGCRFLKPTSTELPRQHFLRLGSWQAETPLLRQIWRYGWPVALWFLCSQGLSVTDRYLIQLFRGYSDAGIYSSLYDVVIKSFSLLFYPIALATHPLIMKYWNGGNRDVAISVVQASLKYQTALCLPILVVLAALAPWVAHLVLGARDVVACRLILPLAIGGFLWQISFLVHTPLQIMCKTSRMLLSILIALGVSLVGNYVLIPTFGYLAAAYVNIAAALAYLLMLAILTPIAEFRRQMATSKSPAVVNS